MIKIIFKNLEKSEFAKDLTLERIGTMVDRFPDLVNHKIDAILSMENSPFKAGPDLFTVKVIIRGKRFHNLVMKKSAPNFYLALAEVVEHSLEQINRYGDKQRVKRRKQARIINVINLHTAENEELVESA